MKFYIKHIGLALLIATFLSSCSKSYLTTSSYDGVVLDVAITSESDLYTALQGVYNGLFSYLGFGRYLPAKGDIMGDNVYCSYVSSGRQNSTYNVYTFTASSGEHTSIWPQLYKVIKRANQIIAADLASSTDVDEYKGEAYAARALSYLELVRNFAYPYSYGSSNPGVPLVTDFFSSDIKPARNTIAEVYAQVISDLEQAYSLITEYTSDAYISKYAVKAIEARVYMDMADWSDAKTAALDVVNNGGFSLVSSTSYVSWWAAQSAESSDKQEAIFSLVPTTSSNNGNESLDYLYYQGGGYGDYLVTDELYNLYSSTDVRKDLIEKTVRGTDSIYASVKYSNAATYTDNVPVIRYSEVLLILAEAYYNTSDDANALLYLNEVAEARDPSFTGYTSTGTQILEDILTEKRKELAFEGNRFWDLYRLQRSFTKVVEQTLGTTLSISLPTTVGSRFPIPQSEI
ncbi:RagB/SusD family nutrient uptake outer membrane protein, partial [Parafilimonas sp.]|uniref:RagB/SusD family nutrient uptake outer membrane protein n=1 Tax=Parafilimonas sp. TaxID=1969739 RepID=UPI0039E354CB